MFCALLGQDIRWAFTGPLVLWLRYRHSLKTFRTTLVFESRIALTLGLGGVRDVTSAIISHEQIQLNRVCCVHLLDALSDN